ncbi:MAG: DivIVA domain-containing protein [Acidimicrobiales bacterium]
MAKRTFPVVRRGYEPRAVDAVVEDLHDRVAHAEATTHAARAYAVSLLDELHRLQALEDELTTALELARQTAQAVVDDAHAQAATILATATQEAGARLAVAEMEARDRTSEAERQANRTLAEGRARLAVEAAEMEKYRLAIVAEASMLQQIEHRLGPRLSRAAARLIEVVDAPDGIGPFSGAAASLVEYAILLQRSVAAGTYEASRLQVQGGEATLHLQTKEIDLRDGDPIVPIDQATAPLRAVPASPPGPADPAASPVSGALTRT